MTENNNSPTPIALVITELNVGGAERALVELARNLDCSQFSPTVYSLMAEPQGEQRMLVEELVESEVPLVFLGARSWWGAPRAFWRLWRHFRRNRPEVVQTFLFHANLVGTVAAQLAGVTSVFTGIRVAEPRAWHLRLTRWIDRWVTRHICVSAAVADYMHGVGKLPSEKLEVIPNGITLNRFANFLPVDRNALGIASGREVVTFIGRLDPQKGLNWLLQLAAQLFARFDDVDLLIVGHGPAKNALERLVGELRIGGRVHFAGWREDIPAILAFSTVLVLPSEWEGMPNVVLEAMAAGKPVVACDVQGVSELLGPLADRQMVSQGDSTGFINRLADFLQNSELAEQTGAENQRRAAAEFSLGTMVSHYERLFRSHLERT